MESGENTEVQEESTFVEEKTLALRKPVRLGKGDKAIEYDHLDLREPNAGELEKASKATTQVGVVLNLISLVAKVPRGVAEGLCQRDLKEASDFLGSFNEDALETGGTSSPS
jgi:hypothetical protein